MPATQTTPIYGGHALVHFHEDDPRHVIEVSKLQLPFEHPSMTTGRRGDTGVSG